jgi:transposase
MPVPSKPAADVKPEQTPIARKPDNPKERQAENLKHLERKAKEKLKRIDTWPKEHQEAARARAQENLNQIQQRMKKLAS